MTDEPSAGRPRLLPTLPADFWEARGLLKEVRDRAHARCAAADGVLLTVMVSLSAHIPAQVAIETGLGRPVRPTLFGVLAGPSGGGKSLVYGVGRSLLPEGAPVPLQVSTGQGIAEGFYGTVLVEQPQPDGKPPKLVLARRRVRSNLMLHLDEGEALFRHMRDEQSITGATLRSFWSGADLGQGNAEHGRRRTVAAGTYTGGLIIGLQPAIAGELLADTETGNSQRYLWAATADPAIPRGRATRARLAGTGPLPWERPRLAADPAYGSRLEAWEAQPSEDAVWREPLPVAPELMTVEASVLDELHDGREAVARGEKEPATQDAQRPAQHVKVAAALAWLDSRMTITREDWQLAGVMLETSAAVRDALIEYGEERSVRAARDKGVERARVRAAEVEADVVRERCAASLTLKLSEAGPAGLTHAELRKAVSRPQRPFVVEVLEAMVARDAASVAEAPHGGRRYRLGPLG